MLIKFTWHIFRQTKFMNYNILQIEIIVYFENWLHGKKY